MNHEQHPQPAAQPPATPRKRSRPRSGPIIWGTLILAFCAWITQRTFAPETSSTGLWIATTVLGLGALLLIVGVSVVLRTPPAEQSVTPPKGDPQQ